MASLAGIILTARVGGGQPSFGVSYEFDAIAAATIGGVSHGGGVGTVVGAIAGILILGVINNGLTLLSVSANWQNVTKGLIIITAVIIDMRKYRKQKIKKTERNKL